MSLLTHWLPSEGCPSSLSTETANTRLLRALCGGRPVKGASRMSTAAGPRNHPCTHNTRAHVELLDAAWRACPKPVASSEGGCCQLGSNLFNPFIFGFDKAYSTSFRSLICRCFYNTLVVAMFVQPVKGYGALRHLTVFQLNKCS